jgi:Tol biopolymer transport system component
LFALALLLIAALGTWQLSSLSSGSSANPGGDGAEVTDGVVIDGTITFARDGALWSLSGSTLTQLTAGPSDGELAWSPDGTWLYFVRQRNEIGGRINAAGGITPYRLRVPTLMRIGARGDGEEEILDGLLADQNPKLNFSSFIFDPAIGADGRIALATDYKGPSLLGGDVLIRLLQEGGRMTTLDLPDEAPFGHQDPAWSYDGSGIYYVQNGFAQGASASRIIYFDLAAESVVRFGASGFIEPAVSPDGRWIAATRIDKKKGSDVVIMSVATGEVLLEVTRTGRSWSPAWAPDGSSLIFLAASGSQASLQQVVITSPVSGPPTIISSLQLLRDGVDAGVRPAWGGLRSDLQGGATP